MGCPDVVEKAKNLDFSRVSAKKRPLLFLIFITIMVSEPHLRGRTVIGEQTEGFTVLWNKRLKGLSFIYMM